MRARPRGGGGDSSCVKRRRCASSVLTRRVASNEPRRARPCAPSCAPSRAPNKTVCITATEPNRTEPIRTEPNRTEPNQTEPNRTVVVIHAVPGDVCRMTPGHAIPPCRAPGGKKTAARFRYTPSGWRPLSPRHHPPPGQTPPRRKPRRERERENNTTTTENSATRLAQLGDRDAAVVVPVERVVRLGRTGEGERTEFRGWFTGSGSMAPHDAALLFTTPLGTDRRAQTVRASSAR